MEKKLKTPSLTAEQVQSIIDYANDTLPTKYGNTLLTYIQGIAIELEKNAPKNESSDFLDSGKLIYSNSIE